MQRCGVSDVVVTFRLVGLLVVGLQFPLSMLKYDPK